jgi:hypothetical protein
MTRKSSSRAARIITHSRDGSAARLAGLRHSRHSSPYPDTRPRFKVNKRRRSDCRDSCSWPRPSTRRSRSSHYREYDRTWTPALSRECPSLNHPGRRRPVRHDGAIWHRRLAQRERDRRSAGLARTDLMIRAELNNRGPLDYPMDEMNAIAGNGIQSGRSTPSVPPQRDDRLEIQIPPPIFFPY